MGTELASETSIFNELIRLMAQEDFISVVGVQKKEKMTLNPDVNKRKFYFQTVFVELDSWFVFSIEQEGV
jgi:hypothetical protein